jgi:anaerobic ribonucleoside-triphosphate reductase activating protein
MEFNKIDWDVNECIRIAGIVEESIADGPGIRYVIFTQGCPHRCKGCHNPQTHDYSGGKLVKIESIIESIKDNPLLDGITLSGGEPFEQAATCAIIAGEVRRNGLSVITYTGYLFEDLYEKAHSNRDISNLLNNTDILVDGPFILSKRNLLLPFRGSENQRIIDVRKTMNSYQEDGEIIFANF